MELITNDSRKRVFILGSGFSASMGLPTLINLFKEVMEFPEREGRPDKKNINTALDFLSPHFNVAISPPSYPPFEEFLSLVIAAEDFPFFLKGTWESWRNSALRLLTDFMAAKSEQAEKAPLLHQFVDNLQYGDVIITFNWDTLIERALLAQSKKVNFMSCDNRAISVLKLHGSLNWVDVPDDVTLKHPEAVCKLSDSDNVIYPPDYKYYAVWDVLDIPPLIVPPGLSKRVIVNRVFKEIWDEAFQSLSSAASVAFIGYSIPKDDIQARSLLSLGWYTRTVNRTKEPIEYLLIDPDPEICGRYASIISSDFIYYQTYFDEKVLPILFE